MKSIRRCLIALIMFSIFSISYLVISVSAQSKEADDTNIGVNISLMNDIMTGIYAGLKPDGMAKADAPSKRYAQVKMERKMRGGLSSQKMRGKIKSKKSKIGKRKKQKNKKGKKKRPFTKGFLSR